MASSAQRHGKRVRAHANAGVWWALVTLVLMAPACSLSDLVELSSDVLLPSITPVADAPPIPDADLSWYFEGRPQRLFVPVEAGVLAGALNADKSAIILVDSSRDDWLPSYYRAFLDDEDQEPLLDRLLAGLRSLRTSLALDSDRYAELIIALAQSLEYRTDSAHPEPRFPIETVAAGGGDCDDKALLAAALLAREGYDVALLSFDSEQHMTLGIRTNGSTYGRTGYGLVEMTTPTLVGWLPDSVGDGGPLTSDPLVIPIGEGTLSYGAGDDTDALASVFHEAATTSEALVQQIAGSQAEIDALADDVRSRSAELDSLAAAGRYADYNAQVPGFNQLAAGLNEKIETHNALVAQQNEAAGTAQRILAGQTDRRGLATLFSVG